MKPIVTVPNKVLSGMATEVKVFDKKLNTILLDMKTSLIATKNPKGVGLAAPQIGLPLRIFITRPTEKADIRVFINPIVITSKNTDGPPSPPAGESGEASKMEGCLSVPNLWGKVKRNNDVTLKFQNENGIIKEETFTGFLSTIIQHETDHINGILFVQRILEQKGKLFEVVTDEDGKEVFEEVQLH
mgnify:CR=1 FL=1